MHVRHTTRTLRHVGGRAFRNAGRATALTLFALAAPLAPAAAQATRSAPSDSIPRELAEALLRPYVSVGFGGSSAFVVGKVPPSLAPFLYVPPNAHLIGGIETPSSTIAVFSVPMQPDQVRAMYAREEPKLGWAPPPDAAQGWGFAPAPAANGVRSNGTDFCHIGQSLQIQPNYSADGVTQVTATVQAYGYRCAQQRSIGGRPAQGPDMPTLVNPPGSAMNQRDCNLPSSMGLGTSGTSERLESSLSASQLMEFFARQLADSGWKTGGNAEPGERRTWTRPDTAGFARELTVTALPLQGTGAPPNCRDVTMTVRLLPPLRRVP